MTLGTERGRDTKARGQLRLQTHTCASHVAPPGNQATHHLPLVVDTCLRWLCPWPLCVKVMIPHGSVCRPKKALAHKMCVQACAGQGRVNGFNLEGGREPDEVQWNDLFRMQRVFDDDTSLA